MSILSKQTNNMCLLFQDILMLIENNIKDQPDVTLLHSMLKVFSLLKMEVQFSGDELSNIYIICNCCKKQVHCYLENHNHR